jgi:anti-anti-sigma factor
MPTQITQIDTPGKTILRVEGEMLLEDAQLIKRIIASGGDSKPVSVDVADLDFMDSEAASVLKHLRDEDGVEIQGIEIFLQSIVNDVERT